MQNNFFCGGYIFNLLLPLKRKLMTHSFNNAYYINYSFLGRKPLEHRRNSPNKELNIVYTYRQHHNYLRGIFDLFNINPFLNSTKTAALTVRMNEALTSLFTISLLNIDDSGLHYAYI